MVSGRCARIKPLFNKKKVSKDLSIDLWTLFIDLSRAPTFLKRAPSNKVQMCYTTQVGSL